MPGCLVKEGTRCLSTVGSGRKVCGFGDLCRPSTHRSSSWGGQLTMLTHASCRLCLSPTLKLKFAAPASPGALVSRPCWEAASVLAQDFFLNLLILLLSALGLRCFVQAFSNCRERGLVFIAVCGFLTEAASLAAEHGLWSVGSVVIAHRLCCSAACGITLDQGWNPCPLHRQADSYPPDHQGSP